MKFGKDRVSVGDAFARVGSRSVYIVQSLVEGPPGTPVHARLAAAAPARDGAMLMSVSALTDPRFFVRVARED
jgi:hypothetical protein